MTWAPVPGWENLYEASDAGEVRSIGRFVPARSGKTAFRKGRTLKAIAKNNGYLCVTLTDGVRRPQIAVHRLIARVFIGECPIGLHVLHNDGDKTNNAIRNLRYGTPAENHCDTERHGRRLKGSAHPRAKLTERTVIDIRLSTAPASQVAKEFGVNVAHVYALRSRRVWRHI